MPKPERHPTLPAPCQCAHPLADPDVMTCVYCGRQVYGVPIPPGGGRGFVLGDHSQPARKTRHVRAAP